MPVELKRIQPKDPDIREFQQNVADALQRCQDAAGTVVGVLSVSSNTKLVGNEDVVLVDAGSAGAALSLILPGVKVMRKLLTVKVVQQGSFPVVIKAVDIHTATTPKIDGGNQVTVSGSVRVVSDGRAFHTV
jgi:hypothetical protein